MKCNKGSIYGWYTFWLLLLPDFLTKKPLLLPIILSHTGKNISVQTHTRLLHGKIWQIALFVGNRSRKSPKKPASKEFKRAWIMLFLHSVSSQCVMATLQDSVRLTQSFPFNYGWQQLMAFCFFSVASTTKTLSLYFWTLSRDKDIICGKNTRAVLFLSAVKAKGHVVLCMHKFRETSLFGKIKQRNSSRKLGIHSREIIPFVKKRENP